MTTTSRPAGSSRPGTATSSCASPTRQSAFSQAKADHDFVEQELELELHTNTELTRQIHVLTTELHRRLLDGEDRDVERPPAGT